MLGVICLRCTHLQKAEEFKRTHFLRDTCQDLGCVSTAQRVLKSLIQKWYSMESSCTAIRRVLQPKSSKVVVLKFPTAHLIEVAKQNMGKSIKCKQKFGYSLLYLVCWKGTELFFYFYLF